MTALWASLIFFLKKKNIRVQYCLVCMPAWWTLEKYKITLICQQQYLNVLRCKFNFFLGQKDVHIFIFSVVDSCAFYIKKRLPLECLRYFWALWLVYCWFTLHFKTFCIQLSHNEQVNMENSYPKCGTQWFINHSIKKNNKCTIRIHKQNIR